MRELCCLLNPYTCHLCETEVTYDGSSYSICSAHQIKVEGNFCEMHYTKDVKRILSRFKPTE